MGIYLELAIINYAMENLTRKSEANIHFWMSESNSILLTKNSVYAHLKMFIWHLRDISLDNNFACVTEVLKLTTSGEEWGSASQCKTTAVLKHQNELRLTQLQYNKYLHFAIRCGDVVPLSTSMTCFTANSLFDGQVQKWQESVWDTWENIVLLFSVSFVYELQCTKQNDVANKIGYGNNFISKIWQVPR